MTFGRLDSSVVISLMLELGELSSSVVGWWVISGRSMLWVFLTVRRRGLVGIVISFGGVVLGEVWRVAS